MSVRLSDMVFYRPKPIKLFVSVQNDDLRLTYNYQSNLNRVLVCLRTFFDKKMIEYLFFANVH